MEKAKRAMDWGTPRLVTKNNNHRVINLTTVNQASRSSLLQIANIRQGTMPHKNQKQAAFMSNYRKNIVAQASRLEQNAGAQRPMAPSMPRMRSCAPGISANEPDDELVRRISFDKLEVQHISKDVRSASVFIDVAENN